MSPRASPQSWSWTVWGALAVCLVLLLGVALVPTSSYATYTSTQQMTIDVADAGAFPIDIDASASVPLGETGRLVNVTNNHDASLNVTVTLATRSHDDADLLYRDGTVAGNSATYLVSSGETLVVNVSVAGDVNDDSLTATATTSVGDGQVSLDANRSAEIVSNADGLTSVAYVPPAGNLTLLNSSTDVATDLGVSGTDVSALGRYHDFSGDGTVEVPYVTPSGSLLWANDSGTRTLVSGGVLANATLGVGNATGTSAQEIYYLNEELITVSGEGALKYWENGTAVEVLDGLSHVKAHAVAGVGNLDGDPVANDVVFTYGGEVKYYDWTTETVQTTGVTIDSNTAVGSPADFNEDGKWRVPAVKDGVIVLIGGDGTVTNVTGATVTPGSGSLAVTDWDGDSVIGLIFLNLDTGTLYHVEPGGTTVEVYVGRSVGAEEYPGVR